MKTQKHYAKKPYAKDHTLYDSIYIKCPENAKILNQKVDL